MYWDINERIKSRLMCDSLPIQRLSALIGDINAKSIMAGEYAPTFLGYYCLEIFVQV